MPVTGLEIAGIVLGSLSLTVSALEHYNKGLRILNGARIKPYEKAVKKYINDFSFESICFRANVETMLAAMSVAPQTIDILLACDEGSVNCWKDKDLARKMVLFLGESFHVVVYNISQISEGLESMRKELRLPRDSEQLDELSQLISRKQDKYWKRLQYATREAERSRRLEALSDLNRRLQTIVKLSSGRRARRSVSTGPLAELSNFSKQASSLFSALMKGWNCSCHDKLAADLCLEPRIDQSPFPSNIRLRLGLTASPASNASHPHAGQSIYEIESRDSDAGAVYHDRDSAIEVDTSVQEPVPPHVESANCQGKADSLDGEECGDEVVDMDHEPDEQRSRRFKSKWISALTLKISALPSPNSKTQNSILASSRHTAILRPKKLRKDRPVQLFAVSNTSDQEISMTGTRNDMAASTNSTSEILDLCQALQEEFTIDNCIGAMFDSSTTLSHFFYARERHAHTAEGVLHRNGSASPGLTKIQSPGSTRVPFARSLHKLSHRNRCYLAVTLASSFLQLSGTPWIGMGWNERNLEFSMDSNAPRTTKGPTGRLFVSQTIESESKSILSLKADSETSDKLLKLSARALGILLVELATSRPLEAIISASTSTASIPPLDDTLLLCRLMSSDFKIRSESLMEAGPKPLLEIVNEEMGRTYAAAIERCLKLSVLGNRDISTSEFYCGKPEDDRLRLDVLDSVLHPLWNLYEKLYKLK